jgi:hypothetical protein
MLSRQAPSGPFPSPSRSWHAHSRRTPSPPMAFSHQSSPLPHTHTLSPLSLSLPQGAATPGRARHPGPPRRHQRHGLRRRGGRGGCTGLSHTRHVCALTRPCPCHGPYTTPGRFLFSFEPPLDALWPLSTAPPLCLATEPYFVCKHIRVTNRKPITIFHLKRPPRGLC